MDLGVDIGGTFTDLIAFDAATGTLTIHKRPSTPRSPADAVILGIHEAKIDMHDAARFVYATTAATNAIIERKGAKTGFITTKGHRDSLEIARITRFRLYDLQWVKLKPLVPRYLRIGVEERLDPTGHVLRELDEDQVKHALDFLASHDVKSVAVCLLFSYTNPVHEQTVKRIAETRFPDLSISVSSELLPQWREYERASTVVADAYIKPLVREHLTRLHEDVKRLGFKHDILVMKSNGGVMTSELSKQFPVHIIESGPTAGVIAASFIGKAAGFENTISFDMGGTTAKAGLIAGGLPRMTTEYAIGGVAAGDIRSGYPLMIPVIDLAEVGAGGGSIAWVDAAGGLKVGPQSSGADPGPACYGLGGEDPTVTDANLVLGRLSADYFLGGRMKIDKDLAYRAIQEKVGKRLDMDVTTTAQGIIDIVVANMAQAIRMVSVERGHDPREFTLVAFGGAGPLHAGAIADTLQIPTVVVPPYPGATSAMGLLMADMRFDFVRSFPSRLEHADVNKMKESLAEMASVGADLLKKQGYERAPVKMNSLDMRYEGQNYEINIPTGAEMDIKEVRKRFDQEHARLYGFSSPEVFHEIINLRSIVVGKIEGVDLLGLARRLQEKQGPKAFKGTRPVFFRETNRFVECSIYERDTLSVNELIRGPAIVEEFDSTILVPPSYVAKVDEARNVILSTQK